MRRDDETRPRPWHDRDLRPDPRSTRGSNLDGPTRDEVERWRIGPTVDDGRTLKGVRVA